ncbi:MFS transporter [Streptomyces sp. WMMC500]|uniref:MFS transporter n=1 Tax=Streptomyces sp. WMMC500 TaxID=3015154 RepID=UPI00248D3168|nr:MFS transporter [Streptomyces sp. WMMC500]WBB62062.1 MFS transporter [Streptomyces sp. WMMC500]
MSGINVVRRFFRGPLMEVRDFRLLLVGFAVSKVGSQVTLVALPLVAVLELDASPFELGLLTATETATLVVAGLPAGVWVDRIPRLPVLVHTDLLRFAAISSIPVTAAFEYLSMAQLYVVASVTGAATVLYDVANQSAVPTILPRERLIGGNGAVAGVQSSAEVMGPGFGGGLVQVVGAPLALLADSISYLVSAVLLLRIKVRETVVKTATRRSLRKEITEGVGFVLRHPLLRVIAVTTGLANLFTAFLFVVQVVFWTKVLLLSPLSIGLVLSASALGGLAGALLVQRLAARVGQVRLILLSLVVTSPFALLWPLSSGAWGSVTFAVGLAVVWFGAIVYNIAQLTFRQLVCPNELLGRMNATMRFVASAVMPLGAVAGGALATAAGPRAALWICAVGFLSGPVPLLLSPFRRLRDSPAEPDEGSRDEAAGDVTEGVAPDG